MSDSFLYELLYQFARDATEERHIDLLGATHAEFREREISFYPLDDDVARIKALCAEDDVTGETFRVARPDN